MIGDKEHRQKVNEPSDLFIIDMTGASLLWLQYFLSIPNFFLFHSYQSINLPKKNQ